MDSSPTRRRRLRRIAMAAGILLIVLLFSLQGILVSLIGPVARPLVELGTWISERAFWWREESVITMEELQDVYEDRDVFAQRALDVERLREENKLLKDEIGFLDRTALEGIPASILAKSFSQSSNRFVVDVGAATGVHVGAAVVSGDGMYVGKVTEVGEKYATISALTDPSHSVAVSLLNERRTIGVASGSVGDLLRIDFIPVDETVTENDLVVTSGLESGVPSGLLVGIINSIILESGSPFQQAIVEPLTDIRRLSIVLILPQTAFQP